MDRLIAVLLVLTILALLTFLPTRSRRSQGRARGPRQDG
jgi:hypothetical protein